MKNKKKILIVLYVKQGSVVPDESGKAHEQGIRNFIYKQIILPYGCDPSIRYAPISDTPGGMAYYITRGGSTKKSVVERIRKHLGLIAEIWPDLVDYKIIPYTETDELKS